MEIKYHQHKIRTQKAKALWLKIAEEYNRGDSPDEIAKRHINPLTKKPYTRGYIYWALNKISKIKN